MQSYKAQVLDVAADVSETVTKHSLLAGFVSSMTLSQPSHPPRSFSRAFTCSRRLRKQSRLRLHLVCWQPRRYLRESMRNIESPVISPR